MSALVGLNAELGVLMMLYLNLAYRQRKARGEMRDFSDLSDHRGRGGAAPAAQLMTGLTLLLGLLPITWSTGSGADVMKRMAAPMVGGITSALVMVLVVFPALFAFWKGREIRSR